MDIILDKEASIEITDISQIKPSDYIERAIYLNFVVEVLKRKPFNISIRF